MQTRTDHYFTLLADTLRSEKYTVNYSYLPLNARPANVKMLLSPFHLLIAAAPRSMATRIKARKDGAQCDTNTQRLPQNYQVTTTCQIHIELHTTVRQVTLKVVIITITVSHDVT